jgi:hypothetical protein
MKESGHGLLWDDIQEYVSKEWRKPQKLVGGIAGIRNLQSIKQKFYHLGYDDRFSAVEIKAVLM